MFGSWFMVFLNFWFEFVLIRVERLVVYGFSQLLARVNPCGKIFGSWWLVVARGRSWWLVVACGGLWWLVVVARVLF